MADTIKMSKMGSHKMAGYFDYVVPPLEVFWWREGKEKIDYTRKMWAFCFMLTRWWKKENGMTEILLDVIIFLERGQKDGVEKCTA